MKIIHRYIASDFLVLFISSIALITFVLSIGVIFKVTELLAKGASARPLLSIFLSGLPIALALAIPLSTLVAVLLLFGRLSSDSEIAAMKSCGISLYNISVAPLTIALISTLVCFLLHNQLAPQAHYLQKKIVVSMNIRSPTDLIEEGRFLNDFMEGIIFYVGKKMKGGVLQDVRIYDRRDPTFVREIRARSAIMERNTNTDEVVILLRQVTLTPFTRGSDSPAFCEEFPFPIGLSSVRKEYEKKEEDLTFMELRTKIQEAEADTKLNDKDRSVARMRLLVEMNKRLSLSLSCLAFVVLGIPLGIKSHRKESSIGIALSLFLVMNFYLFIVIAKSVMKRPGVPADMIVWIPVVLSLLVGAWLMHRSR